MKNSQEFREEMRNQSLRKPQNLLPMFPQVPMLSMVFHSLTCVKIEENWTKWGIYKSRGSDKVGTRTI